MPAGMVYQWRDGSHKSGDPQVIGERIEALRVASGGFLAAAAVVEDAKPESAPTHYLFEWDDDKAAAQYRLVQAREVIRSIRIASIPDHTAETPAFVVVAVPKDAAEDDTGSDDDVTTAGLGTETRYTSTLEAMRDPRLKRQVLRQAVRDLAGWRKRYAALQEFARLFGAVDEIVQQYQLDGPPDTTGQ